MACRCGQKFHWAHTPVLFKCRHVHAHHRWPLRGSTCENCDQVVNWKLLGIRLLLLSPLFVLIRVCSAVITWAVIMQSLWVIAGVITLSGMHFLPWLIGLLYHRHCLGAPPGVEGWLLSLAWSFTVITSESKFARWSLFSQFCWLLRVDTPIEAIRACTIFVLFFLPIIISLAVAAWLSDHSPFQVMVALSTISGVGEYLLSSELGKFWLFRCEEVSQAVCLYISKLRSLIPIRQSMCQPSSPKARHVSTHGTAVEAVIERSNADRLKQNTDLSQKPNRRRVGSLWPALCCFERFE